MTVTVNVRGTVAGDPVVKTVETTYGERELAEVPVRVDTVRAGGLPAGAHPDGSRDGVEVGDDEDHTAEGSDDEDHTAEAGTAETPEPTTVTLWGSWTESAEWIEAGMELLVVDAERETFRGEAQFSTTGDSYVVVEPGFLVDVTSIRSWVECPRLYYLNKLSGIPLNYPVLKGTVVHEVFGDLLRGRDLDESIDARIEERGLELGLLGESRESVAADVRENARAIEGWLEQGRLTDEDDWRSEQLLISETFGIRGRADAIRRGAPVELKTGKNLRKEPRFKDKVQAACYALLLEEEGADVDTGTLLYTKNSALERSEESGDLTPAKDFSMGAGLLSYVVRLRNEIAAMEIAGDVPTGYEGEAKCEYCFEQDTCMVVSGRLNQDSKAGAIGTTLPEEELEHFERFSDAIEAERRAVHREYAKLWEQTAKERAEDDRALVDLEFVGKRELEGGRWELLARRTSAATSKIRDGDLVLASDGDPIRGDAELARIERLGRDGGTTGGGECETAGVEAGGGETTGGGDGKEEITSEKAGEDERTKADVVLTADEPVSVSRVDVYPSEFSTDRLLAGLHDALLKGADRRKDVLFGREAPTFEEPEATFIDTNPAQDAAVRRTVGAEDFALIHGPPGTGKTFTIARAVEAMLDRGERLLLSAFTNRAVDNVLEAVVDVGIDPDRIVRIGSESGVRADMQDLRLERSGDPEERANALGDADIVAATTSACGSRMLKTQGFDVALVDEAGQLTEPGTYAAIELAERFVLVGDHQQLPPVVRAETDLSTSLFERLVDQYPKAGVLLDRQYRMNQRIQAFPSAEFYDGELRPATPEVARRTLEDLPGVNRDELPPERGDPVSFVHAAGDGSRHTDAEEAARVAELVETYEAAGVDRGAIGVIAPFRAQVGEISKRVPDGVAVDTVDRFQGSSKEVIVVSFVATETLDGPIFEDYRRLNVALTRPKRALVLVGDEGALRRDPVYRRMLEWAER